MTEQRELIRSVNHALSLTAAGCLAAFFWLFFRLPHSNLMVVSGAFLLTGLLYDIASWKERLCITVKVLFHAGVLQFLLGVSHPGKFLQLFLVCGYVFFLLGTSRSRAVSSTALLIGTIGLAAPPGFYPSATRFLDFLLTGTAVMVVTSVVGVVHKQNRWMAELPPAYSKVQALRIAVVYGIGIWLIRAFHFPQGLWIVFCMAMVYYGCSSGGDVVAMAKQRIFSTPLGLIFCYLYLGCLAFFDYRMTYLIPLIGGFGFFLLYYIHSYFAFTVVFLMTFSIYADIATGDGRVMHFMQLFLSRSLASVIGIFLLILYERYFLPDAPSGEKEVV